MALIFMGITSGVTWEYSVDESELSNDVNGMQRDNRKSVGFGEFAPCTPVCLPNRANHTFAIALARGRGLRHTAKKGETKWQD